MGSSSYHPQSKQQGRHSPLSLSQPEPLPLPPSYTTSSGSGTSSGSHSPSHINFHPPRVSAFASSTFASHNNHPHHHHPHHPNTIQHPHPPLHDRIGAHEEAEQRYGTPSQSSLSLATTTALASATTSTPYASTSYLPSTSASITTFDAAPPLLHSATTPLPSASSSTVGLHQPPSIITTMGLPHHQHHSHQQQKDKSQLSIILDAPYLTLKGTGPDVEPTTLSGHVLLHLTESTTLKEITLQFRGKAKIPMPANESLINNSTSITYVVCNHDWSFLESGSSSGHTSTQGSSSKKHSRTLKAGNHYFPFSLAIGGTLPSSTSTSALGGASVVYKLRAVATRPGFAHNLQAIAPVPLLRTFTPEALEYQQTLEIENTWPDKMMYAIMLPHKAWAAGDVLGAVVKFSPLSKGVRVASVVSTLWETSKIFARSGTQEETRPVCSTRHEIVDGRAVEVDWSQHGAEKHKLGFSFTGASQPASAQGYRDFGHHGSDSISSSSSSTALTEAARRRQQREEEEERERQMGYENNDIVTCITMPIPPSSCSDPATPSGIHHPTSPLATTSSHFASFSHPNSGTSTPVTSSTPPTLVTPSHSLEPIVVSHRLRWSIYIRNRDGHISELRCSLPVVILDGRLKEEARDASMISRRMMIRSCVGLEEMSHEDEEVWGIDALGQDVGGSSVGGAGGLVGEEGAGRGGGDRELPSYNAHVRDRVANMFLPEAVTMRVNNPWINRSGPTSPAAGPDSTGDPMGSNTSSTMPTTTLATNAAGAATSSAASEHSAYPHADVMSHLPHAPSGSGTSTPLDWVNSELLLSLGDDPMRRLGGGGTGGADSGPAAGGPSSGSFTPLPAGMRTPPSVLQYVSPVPAVASGSRWGSRGGSRAGSRAGSPERGGGDHQVLHHGSGEERDRDGRSRPSSPVNAPTTIGYVYEPLPSAAHSSHTSQNDSSSHHDSSHGHGLRLHNLFKATMKPFTALSHKNRHDDKDKDHQHHQREGRSGVSSREGSSGGNSRSSREHSPTTTTNETPLTSAASTYTYDSALNSPVSSAMSHDLFAAAFSGSGPSGPGSAEDQSQSRDHVNLNFGSSSQQTSMPLSMSTSELAALRRTAISSPYSQGNAQQQQQRRPLTGPALLHRALTEVPDYSIASRGFLGGVPPLTSMRGLPSYQEAVGSPQAGRTPSPLSGGGVETTDGSTTTAATTPAVPAPLRSVSSEPDLANHFTLSSSQSQSQPRPHPHLHTHTHDQDPLSVHVIDRALAATALEEEEDALAETDGVGILQRLESAGAISGMGGGVGASSSAGAGDVGRGRVEEPDDEDDEEGGSGGSGIEMRMRSRTITQNPQ